MSLAALLYRITGVRLVWGGMALRETLRAYYQADLVLSCGGGYLFASRPLSPAYLTRLLAIGWALALGKRVVMLPQSLGPIQGGLQQQLARFVLNRVDALIVRESRALDYATQILHLRCPVSCLPDLAFRLQPAPPLALPRTVRVGIVPMDWGAQQPGFTAQAKYETALVELAVQLYREHGISIYLICQCTGPSPEQDDRRVARRLHTRLAEAGAPATVLADFPDAYALSAAYAAMDCVVTTRMHGGILTLISHTPVIVLGYQPKSAGIMQMLGLSEFYLPIEEANGPALAARVHTVIANPAPVRSRIVQAVAQTQAQLAGWPARLAPPGEQR